MRKTLRLFFMLTLALLGYNSAFADVTDELTLSTFGVSGTTYTEVTGKTASSKAVYTAQMAGGNSSIQLRSKNSNSGIVTTASGGKLKSVTVAFNAATTDRKIDIYGKNTAYGVPSDLYGDEKGELLGSIAANDENKTLTINGDYTFIGLRSNDGAIYVEKITIVWDGEAGGGTTVTVPAPKINGTTPFTESTEVSISGPDGGSVKYTTDGSDPANGTTYTAPFTITETTTVKAIGYDEDGNASEVAEKTFTKEEAIKVASIKEFNALAENTIAELTLTNAQVLYVNDYNGKEIFVRDATGAIDLYKLGIDAKAGDVLNGTISGKRGKNSGFTMAMIKDNSTDASTVTVTSGNEAAPIDIVIANANDNICDFGVIKEVTIEANGTNKTAVMGENKLPLYDRFKLNLTNDLKTDGSTYNIYGLLYDGGTQYGIELVVTKVELLKEGPSVEPQNVTVAEALEIINGLEDGKTTNEQYKVTGFVVGVPDFQRNAEGALYGNVNFFIADEKGGSNTLNVFRAKDLENVAFTEETINNLKEGDEVVVLGNLQKYLKNETTTPQLTNGYLVSIKSGSDTPATPDMIAFTDGDTAGDGAVFSKGDFKLTQVDTDGKTAIDGNNAYFGTAENYQKFTHRLKTGGKSGSKNSLTLTIPSDGTLNVYVRTGSNSATDRNLVLTQDGTELYNQVVQEADAITVTMGENDNKVYPVITVNVKAGEVAVGYPTGSLNFYGFEFIAGASGVNAVIVEKAKNNIRYNLAGQRVDESYKGVVIMNGNKFVVK